MMLEEDIMALLVPQEMKEDDKASESKKSGQSLRDGG